MEPAKGSKYQNSDSTVQEATTRVLLYCSRTSFTAKRVTNNYYRVLTHDAMKPGIGLTTFRRKLLSPSSGTRSLDGRLHTTRRHASDSVSLIAIAVTVEFKVQVTL